MKAQDVRPNLAINMDGQLWLVVLTDHVKPGKGPAYTQVKLKNMQTGAHIERRLRSGEEIEEASLDRHELEYLYTDGTGAVFMDTESYEQINISAAVLGDVMLYLKPNTSVMGLLHQSKVISIEPPVVVELEVTDTPPGIKGATATNQPKEATMQTGLRIKVPPFIKTGETLRISTATGEYLGRAGD